MAQELSSDLDNPLLLVNSPISMPTGYFRSKLFVASSSSNPFVAAAGPVISLLERMCISSTLPPVETLHDNLHHELKAFASRIGTIQNAKETHAIAYYLLCATVDELLGKNFLRLYKKPIEFGAFTPATPLHAEGPDTCFFTLVSFMKRQPERYLSLLELAYYCLITGFEGRHHAQSDGRMNLDNLIEELFQIIQQHRITHPKRLFKDPVAHHKVHKNRTFFLGICIGIIGMVCFGFIFSYWMLENKVKAVQYNHDIMTTLDE